MTETATLVDLKPNKYQKDRLVGTNHYVMMHDPNGSMKYYLQGGKVYAGLNDLVEDENVPAWLQAKMQTMNPRVLQQCGFGSQTKPLVTDPNRLDQLLAEGLISSEEYSKLTTKEIVNEEVKDEIEIKEEGQVLEVSSERPRIGRPRKQA
tara:strand:- start:150 stop:599 length:450 start_codon:yes stop_codon:yes gene_type:complete